MIMLNPNIYWYSLKFSHFEDLQKHVPKVPNIIPESSAPGPSTPSPPPNPPADSVQTTIPPTTIPTSFLHTPSVALTKVLEWCDVALPSKLGAHQYLGFHFGSKNDRIFRYPRKLSIFYRSFSNRSEVLNIILIFIENFREIPKQKAVFTEYVNDWLNFYYHSISYKSNDVDTCCIYHLYLFSLLLDNVFSCLTLYYMKHIIHIMFHILLYNNITIR